LEASVVKYFDASLVLCFQCPTFSAQEQQVAYVFASEYIFVHRIEGFACLVNLELCNVAVIQLRGEDGI
jgi:hypothetical protein